MKKFVAVLALVIALSLSCSALALGLSASSDHPTVFSFTELYARRLIELESATNTDLYSSTLGLNHLSIGLSLINDGLLHGDCAAGTIAFEPEQLTVEEWSGILQYLNDDPQTTVRYNFQCAVAISALEYDSYDELRMIGTTTPAIQAYYTVLDPIMDKLPTTALKLKAQKNRKQIYQGKYTYYISCMETSDGKDVVMIHAE